MTCDHTSREPSPDAWGRADTGRDPRAAATPAAPLRLVLGPLLRHVDDRSATIWVETSAPARVQVRATAVGLHGRTHPSAPASTVTATTTTFAVHGHHYALALLDGLDHPAADDAPADDDAGTADWTYEVLLDGTVHWPMPDSDLPPSRIRLVPPAGSASAPLRLAFGSCRAAAPHRPPYTSRLDDHPLGKGVDALRALGLRMSQSHPDEWPHLLLFAGDQVYADASSPSTERRIARRRDARAAAGDGHDVDVPDGVVADFEEYTWLYHESWSPEVERWVLSTVPSAMIFDDHDMIDDWNISQSWVRGIRRQPWWSEHVIGGLVSYWLYQHLGNLSPGELHDDGMLDRCLAAGDATELLRHWALSSEEFTPVPGGYRFSHHRRLGGVHLVVMDVRNGRVLEPDGRRMLDDDEWGWVRERALEPADHLVLASSLPVFVPGGLHGIQQWNEAVCDGAWGRAAARLGERLRRAIDLEGWPAFHHSFEAMEQLLVDVASAPAAPHTATIIGGDIHFAYVADVVLPEGCDMTVRQVVCSPMRNILRTRERRVMRFGASAMGQRIGRRLQRAAGRGATSLQWELSGGPVFDDNIGSATFEGASCRVLVEVATLDDDGREILRPAADLVSPAPSAPAGPPSRRRAAPPRPGPSVPA